MERGKNQKDGLFILFLLWIWAYSFAKGFDGICELECWDKTDISASPLALFQLYTSDMLHIVSQSESGSPAHSKERHPWKQTKQTLILNK